MTGGSDLPAPRPADVPKTTNAAAAHLALVVRSTDGADERHLLDVAVMSTDRELLAEAAAAARAFERLDVDGDRLPVFDLRSPGPGAVPASGGCLSIGRRGPVRVALLVD